jgi:anthranilate synthase/phosphoribosyltransferase
VIKHFYDKKPILGICLGHQAIAYIQGAKIINATELVHGKKSDITHFNGPLFKNLPTTITAGRYHSLAVSRENFPDDKLEIIAENIEDKEIMGIKMKDYPVYGLQFHPESILTEHGKTILGNFYNFIMPHNQDFQVSDMVIKKVSQKEDLNEDEAKMIMTEIMNGRVSEVQIAAYLMALKLKGETIDEIVGSIKAIKELMNKIDLGDQMAIDTCGTGGDSSNTFNISSMSALVCAGAGIKVAKHGNRSITSKSGSADIFKALGVKIDADKEIIKKSILEANIGFMFAPLYHPAFKHVGPVRQSLKTRTIFNMLGPTVNPAQVKQQVFGIFDPELTEKFATILNKTGVNRALVFSSAESMDEISPFSITKMSFLNKGDVQTFNFDPEKFGMKTGKLEDIQTHTPEESKTLIESLLNNQSDNQTAINIVLLNAAAGIFIASEEDDFDKGFREGLEQAKISLETNKAMEALNQMIRISNS